MLPFNVWAQSLWETLYMVILSTAISYLIGLPLGLTLVVTDKNGIRPMPVLNTVLGIVTNILRSIPFLILAVMITPVTRAIVGKAIGTTAMVVPLTFAAAPYVARMVESSIKEVPFGVIEAAQSMGASPCGRCSSPRRSPLSWSAARSPSSPSSATPRWPASSAAAVWAR